MLKTISKSVTRLMGCLWESNSYTQFFVSGVSACVKTHPLMNSYTFFMPRPLPNPTKQIQSIKYYLFTPSTRLTITTTNK